MALELTIYNRQTQTSKSGKAYIGYVVAFKPGHREAVPDPQRPLTVPQGVPQIISHRITEKARVAIEKSLRARRRRAGR